MNAVNMLADPRKTYLLWGVEPDLDIDNPAAAMNALKQAENVIAVVSHAADSLRQTADVLLPLAPLAESEGTLVNLDGSFAGFKAAGRACGEARPGWKILRLIGTSLGLDGFGQFSVDDVLSEARAQIDNAEASAGESTPRSTEPGAGLYRIGELPMYSADALCRRSEPLQETAQAENLFIGLNPEDASRLDLGNGDRARVRQGDGQAELEVKISERVPVGGVWLRAATGAASDLGPAYAPVIVEVA
jgi:NADH-quinone oxidoreductase subunit G